MTKDDWDIIEDDCRCNYQGLHKENCRNSYTAKCDECRHNELVIGKTESHYDVD